MRNSLFLLLLLLPQLLWAQTEREEQEVIKVYFRIGTSEIDEHYKDNGVSLKQFADEINSCLGDSTARIGKINITSSSSPDGGKKINERIAKQRAQSITDWLMERTSTTLSYTVEYTDCDWELLIRLVETNPEVPYQSEVLEILRNTSDANLRLNKLKSLRSSRPYNWLLTHVFPELRYAAASITIYREPEPKPVEPVVAPVVPEEPEPVVEQEPVAEPVAEPEQPQPEKKAFYMAVKTNLLYDVAFIPNVGAEFYIGNDWSIAGNWQYIWLRNKAKHKYWKVGAGDIALRKWFGSKASEKPLTGHHIGAYGQMVTYDFAPTGKSGTIAEDWNWSVGIEYGYSLPIARRLNMDFTIGIGYHWGEYKTYDPIDDHSVWQATKQRSFVGPTKLEVSLVWLLGNGNFNAKKGGNR